jgi:glucose uptake protein GlcU
MKQNMGIADRAIRIVLAAVVAVLYFTNQLSMTAAIILGILAVIFLATGIVGVCPLYLPFGLSTKRKGAV